MKHNYTAYICLIITTIFVFACSKDDNDTYIPIEPEVESPVVMDLTQVPYQKTSYYVMFEGELKKHKPVYRVLPFQPIITLLTDYALKKSIVCMSKDSKALYTSDSKFINFPTGT